MRNSFSHPFKFNNSTNNINYAAEIKQKTDPENLDLILSDECDQSGDAKNGHQIYQVMSATGNHSRGGSGAGYADYFPHTLSAMHQNFKVLIERNLNSKSHHQTNNEIPIGRELALSETPSGNQRQHRKINPKQEGAGKCSE